MAGDEAEVVEKTEWQKAEKTYNRAFAMQSDQRNNMAALRGLKELPDAQINDAVKRQDWRVALQLIEQKEKKPKKDEPKDWLAACKASVLLLLPEPAKQQQGRALLEALLAKTPTVGDHDALVIIQAFADQRMDDDPRINALWLKTVNADYKNEDLHKLWFKTKMESRDWQDARKVREAKILNNRSATMLTDPQAAMTYSRHFPTNRQPYFWTIFANYMAAVTVSSTISEQERTLCGTMAFRMCEKAAEDVSSHTDMELNNSGRVLRTPSEIAFLLDVYESQGKNDEALDILDSDRTGIFSRVGKGSFDLVLRKINLLKLTRRYLDLFEFCFQLLADAHPRGPFSRFHGLGKAGNDWTVWYAMYEAVKNIPECEVEAIDYLIDMEDRKTRLWEIAQTFWKRYTNHESKHDRNASCAAMLFYSNDICYDGDTTRNMEELKKGCIDYFKKNGGKSYCFNDLQPYVSRFAPERTNEILHRVGDFVRKHDDRWHRGSRRKLPAKDMTWMQINELKLTYCLRYPSWETEPDKKTPGEPGLDYAAELEVFILQCIDIYKYRSTDSINGTSGTERFSEDDAGILAASALIKLYDMDNHQNALLRAAAILQHLITISPYNYEALVIMAMLRVKLGDGMGAAACYHQLSVKNIQLPTVPWLLCTRISTIHPHSPHSDHSNPTTKHTGEDPIEHLLQALDYYVHLRETDQRDVEEFLEAGQYSNLRDAINSCDAPHLGFAKHMLCLEYSRTRRLLGVKPKAEFESLLDKIPTTTIEDRDRTPVPHWEHPASLPLDEILLPGKWPTDTWLARQFMTAALFNMTTEGNTSFTYRDVMQYNVDFAHSEPDSTAVEAVQYTLAMHCGSTLVMYRQKRPEAYVRDANSKMLVNHLRYLKTWLRNEINEVSNMDLQKENFLWCISNHIDAPGWKFFHAMYTGIENCILIKKTLAIDEAENRKFRLIESQWAEDEFKAIRKLCDDYCQLVHNKARTLREEFSDDRHHSELVHHIVGHSGTLHRTVASEIRDACGEGSARLLVKNLCRGWAEALKNVEKISSA
ncbi:MAG: hypothetical protein Q9218_000063 [Villophora microphyllina]